MASIYFRTVVVWCVLEKTPLTFFSPDFTTELVPGFFHYFIVKAAFYTFNT